MEVKKSVGLSKKDVVRASIAVNTCDKVKETPLTMVGCIFYDKEEVSNETGEITKINVVGIKTKDEEFYTSISPTIKESLDSIINVYSEEEITQGIDIIIKAHKSNSNREFLVVDLL